MTILDSNVLLYAYNADSPHHERVSTWLEQLFGSGETVGLPWITLWAFVRLSTSARLWDRPVSPAAAFEAVRQWLAHPATVLVNPGLRHPAVLEDLVTRFGATGPLVTDAALAALAIEQGAALASTDRDFSRFPQLRWVNPAEA